MASLVQLYAKTNTGTVVGADGITYKIVDGKVTVPVVNKAALVAAGYIVEPSSESDLRTTNVENALPSTVATYATDASGNVIGLVGPDGSTFQTTRMWSSGLPFVLVASGNITSVAGQVTTGTAHDYVIGPSYTFFPASALYSASPAGWYYTNWTSTTVGTVYANTYINGNPQIPASPTALTTVIGAYTQTTAFDVVGPNVVVPANSMGPNGVLEWQRFANNNNSAGNKMYNTYFGGTFFQGVTQTTNPKEAGAGSLKNRGRTSAQVGANASHGDSNNVSTFTKLSIDTTAQQVASMTLQLAVATDYAIVESFLFRLTYSA